MSVRTCRLLPATLLVSALLAACGGGGDSTDNAASGGAAASAVAGCSGKVAAYFALSKGSYTAKAATFDNVGFTTTPASVAGFANGGTQTVTVAEDCTMTVGTLKLSYKDGSYAEFAGTGADLGKTRYDVDMTGTGAGSPHFERFISGKRGLSLFDPTKTAQGVRVDE